MSRLSLCAMILLTLGCGTARSTLKDVPALNSNDKVVWNYVCNDGGLLVEYADLSGNYTATLKFSDDKKIVFERVGTTDRFQLDDLIWQMDDHGYFSYAANGEIKYDGCVARGIINPDSTQLHLKRDFK